MNFTFILILQHKNNRTKLTKGVKNIDEKITLHYFLITIQVLILSACSQSPSYDIHFPVKPKKIELDMMNMKFTAYTCVSDGIAYGLMFNKILKNQIKENTLYYFVKDFLRAVDVFVVSKSEHYMSGKYGDATEVEYSNWTNDTGTTTIRRFILVGNTIYFWWGIYKHPPKNDYLDNLPVFDLSDNEKSQNKEDVEIFLNSFELK